uniref:Retrovirus-related Pol polyprotein from transposon TNT 1-94 n=1 Tax=Tanacetum cinerariifolium TaxID=118510 RepID=A0A6L2L5G0_TANCI|nr:retrovirus-related Pol polyprotein from transposon TNT 1-94 [Tanacetum cinerariifolium]
MRRKERVTGNVLDAVNQVISLAIVQNHLATKIKRPSFEDLGAIAKMTPKTKPTMILVSWLNHRIRDLLEKEILELNERIKKLERGKEIEIACKSCEKLKSENAKLKETQIKLVKFDKSANLLREMLNNQKSPSCKIGLGFDDIKASTSETKNMSFVGSSAEKATDGSTLKVHGSTLPGSALYDLKQAPKAWYDRLKTFLIKHEYSIGMVDNTLFTKKSKSHLIIVQIYVDDIIFGSTSQNLCDDFAKIMHDEFEMSMMGELKFFLGLQIKQMEDEIFFNQSKYIKEMLKKFGLEDSKPTKTSMSTEIKLTKDDEANSMDSSKYRGMIGSLLYLTASRPDIMFSVCLCARFQENPKTTYLEAVKRIFRYIRGNSHLGLWYAKGTKIKTIVYDNSDHADYYVDRKSTSGIFTFMGCCLTYWFTKKQTALAISMNEAKYVSTKKACQQALWIKQALIDYGIRLDDVLIMCDNKGAIDLSKNPIQHSQKKHIEIRHHFLRDNVQKGNISIEKVASEDNIADIFTKPLKRKVLNYLRLGLGMMELIMDSDPSSSQK